MNNLPGLNCVGTIRNPHVNNGAPVPLYEPVSGPSRINTLEGWNAFARKQNRRFFILAHGREPENEEELQAWEEGL